MDPYVIPDQLDHGVIAGNPGEGSLGIGFQKIFHGQVSGNDGCLFIHDTLVDAAEKLRGYKAVGQLRAQIINNEQITVTVERCVADWISLWKVFFDSRSKKVERSAEIQNKIRTVQKLSGDTVGKIKSFQHQYLHKS